MRVILNPADWTQQKVNHDVVLARKSPLQVLDEARSVSTSSWNRDVTRSWGSRALIPSICHANREAGPDNEGRNNHRACLGSQAIWTLTMIEEGGRYALSVSRGAIEDGACKAAWHHILGETQIPSLAVRTGRLDASKRRLQSTTVARFHGVSSSSSSMLPSCKF